MLMSSEAFGIEHWKPCVADQVGLKTKYCDITVYNNNKIFFILWHDCVGYLILILLFSIFACERIPCHTR